MRNITLFLSVAILFAACQPAVTSEPISAPPTELPALTPTSAPVEDLANSIDDLLGVWWYPRAGVKVEYKVDGTFRVYGPEAVGELDTGIYTFESGKLTSISKTSSCADNPATYEVFVSKEDDNPVSIRLQVVGEDTCQSRANLLAEEGKFQKP